MILKPFEGPGSTSSRRRFWNDARSAVLSSVKVAGRHVTVDEHPGKGSVINVGSSGERGRTPGGATGACCIGNSCSILTADACADAGGIYYGDGTVCDPNPCCNVTLACDSIAASKSKCGFGPFGGTPVPCSPYGCIQINCDGTYSNPAPHANMRYLQAYCAPCPGEVGSPVTSIVDPSTCITNEGCSCGSPCNSCICPTCYNSPYPCGNSFSVVLSSEYTTAMLIDNTIAALPDYDGIYDDDCQASRELPSDELSYSVERFKPRFSIPSALGSNLTIYYNEHFEPDVGSPSDIPRSAIILAGMTSVVGLEVFEPTSNGIITITNISCNPP